MSGFLVVLCGTARCGGPLQERATEVLGAAVRAASHSVLVRSGCTAGPVACRMRAPGPMVVVQPCDRRLRPAGPAVRIGPLRSDADLDALIDWLGADRDPDRLPEHLAGTHRSMIAAGRN